MFSQTFFSVVQSRYSVRNEGCPTNIYLFKVNNRNARKRGEKGVFLLLTLSTFIPFFNVSIVTLNK